MHACLYESIKYNQNYVMDYKVSSIIYFLYYFYLQWFPCCLKQQCDEPAISSLSQLELQLHFVREVQRRLRLGRFSVTDGWRRTALKIYASQLGLSILRPDENLGSMYKCQVRSRQRWIHHTLLARLCWVQMPWTPLIVVTDRGLFQSCLETRLT